MNFIILLIITDIVITSRCIHSQLVIERNTSGDEKSYTKLFKLKRAEQLAAVKTLKKMMNTDKQQTMINLMADKIFTIIQERRAFIESSSYIPGVSQFPTDVKVRDALSNILENTSLFCDLVLRFPNIVTPILKKNNNWNVLLQWSIGFSNEVQHLLDNNTVRLLHLASQELNHIKRDPDYVNPYRDHIVNHSNTDGRVKKTKKKIKKGPKIAHYHSEL